jgi:excisionase family DNA binding protein
MNTAVNTFYAEYLEHTGGDKAAAASLALAAVLVEGGRQAPPPVSLTADEAAARLRINRKTLYGMCRRRAVRCYRAGRHLRIPLEEIERLENASGAKDRASRFPDVIKEYF